MNITLITPATSDLLTKTEMRMHARTADAGATEETPSNEDASLQAFGGAAQELVEMWTNRALLESTWEVTLDQFPCGSTIYLPKGKIKAGSVSVYYTPNGSAEQTFHPSKYIADPGGDRGPSRIVLGDNQHWPADTLVTASGVRIRFVAGWATASLAPKTLKQAVLMLFSHFYDNREAVVIGNTAAAVSKEIEVGVRALIRNWILEPIWNQHE
jgi:uncharacterized phiE125 gp8 family phage protein